MSAADPNDPNDPNDFKVIKVVKDIRDFKVAGAIPPLQRTIFCFVRAAGYACPILLKFCGRVCCGISILPIALS